ncbi:MAG: hypothetical protein JXA28_14640 [Bacteroidetes bacterium]|nr:hypothetical protein [Bacteroidota bacterium]
MDRHFHSCQDVVDYICEHFGDDTDSERCLELAQHLEHCPDCNAYCNSIDKMIGLYRATSPCFSDEARHVLLDALGIDETD